MSCGCGTKKPGATRPRAPAGPLYVRTTPIGGLRAAPPPTRPAAALVRRDIVFTEPVPVAAHTSPLGQALEQLARIFTGDGT